jgi:outer membrane protein assembly factor BamE (lipoprotein component of BamABCDE complex)
MVRPAALLPAALLASALVAGALPGCAPISSTHGFQALDVKPAELKVGEDTKSTVLERLGSPSAMSTFDPNLWFYISQGVEQKAFYRPRVTNRDVVAVTFDPAEKVAGINSYKLADGKVIAFNDRETPTRGRELTIIEQLLGNVGRGMAGGLGQREEDQTPGGRRRE